MCTTEVSSEPLSPFLLHLIQSAHRSPSNCFKMWIKLLPRYPSAKEPACQCRRCKRCVFNTRIRKFPWWRTWHPSILAWRIPRTEEPGGLQSMGLQRVGHDWSDLAHTHVNKIMLFLVLKYFHCFPGFWEHKYKSSPWPESLYEMHYLPHSQSLISLSSSSP